MPAGTSRISCIIRTFNESKHIGRLIENLRSQDSYGASLEIVVVDSGSTDDTVRIAQNCSVKLIEIQKEEFHFSKSLNLGIENSYGDLLVILSAHSIPAAGDWLKRMVGHFDDPNVAGVYCRQVPWPDADLCEVLRIAETFGDRSTRYSKDHFDPDHLTFSNAASCIRRCVWQQHPFTLPAAEDWEWAKWTIEEAYTIVYDAEAQVYHSHNESCRRLARRWIELQRAADIFLLRKRSRLLTARQAAGYFIRGLARTFSSDVFEGARAKYSLRCLAQAFWCFVDFSGTAEVPTKRFD
jgi:glycosyltransferase involved in cell wall biosynthesis